MKRLFALTILASLFAAGLTAAGLKANSAPRETSPSIQVAKSSGGTITLYECRIKLDKHAILASDRSGILESIMFKEGMEVTAGAVIAELKSDAAQAAKAVALLKSKDTTEIDYADLTSKHAKLVLEKAQQANNEEPGTVPEIEIQQHKLEWEKSIASIKKAKMQKEILGLQFKEAEAQLKTYKVFAPFKGIVTKRLKNEGEAVRQGDPIIQIVNTKTVIIEGYIDYRDRARLAVGNGVVVQLELTDDKGIRTGLDPETYPGKLIFIDETAQARGKVIFIKAEVKNPNKQLFPGLTAMMKIQPNLNAGK